MKKYKFFKLSKTKKLRYLSNNINSNIWIVFLHGFASDIEGKKPHFIKKYAKINKLGFLAMEYSGHGKSYGKFINGNISKWTHDAKQIISKKIKNKKIILVGSSMGAWISLNLFKFFANQIVGFIGIGSAPEFLQKLMWNKFSKKIKKEIKSKGYTNIKNGDYDYLISYQLIKDGIKNKVLNKKIKSKIKITMLHGSKDEVVPISFSKKILKTFPYAIKKLRIIKNGDHSLSSKKNLKTIVAELKLIIKHQIN